MPSRRMPQEGYWLYPSLLFPTIIYCSGTKSGNSYWRPSHDSNGIGFAYLLWTCVPGQQSIRDYLRFNTEQEARDYLANLTN